MKRFWKENKVLIVLAIIILVAVIAMGVGLFTYFYNPDTDVYGNRLKGIENYPIDKNINETIKSSYENGVESVKVDIKGKIVYVIIDVDPETSKENARKYAETALTKFTEEEQNFYDFQFMMTSSKEKESEDKEKVYPILGYKNSSSLTIVWTNN